jgi:hypothetical protein
MRFLAQFLDSITGWTEVLIKSKFLCKNHKNEVEAFFDIIDFKKVLLPTFAQ